MAKKDYSDYYIVVGEYDAVVKHDGDRYPRHSVLAGQVVIKYIDTFNTVEEAQAEYPTDRVMGEMGEKLFGHQNTFDHLPDEPDY